MKVKDTRKKPVKELELNLEELEQHIEVTANGDYVLSAEIQEPITGEHKIFLHIRTAEIKANISLRLVLRNNAQLILHIVVIAHAGAKGAESELDMNALLMHPDASITFVPSLEIDEMDVSVDHKSTIGIPEKSWMQYMASRGVDKEMALDLLSISFLNN